MNSKKGDLSALQILIISLVALIFLSFIAYRIAGIFGSSGKIGACQTSILAASVIEKATPGVSAAALLDLKLSKLKCNDLPDTEIKAKNVIKRGDLDENAVKRKIADSMLGCWKMVGRGQVDPYGKYDDDQVYCMICSDIVFEPEVAEKAKENVLDDFVYYLAATNVPGLETSYFEELYGEKPDNTRIKSLQGVENPFDTGQQYTIVWRMDRVALSQLGNLVSTSAGTVGTAYLAILGAKAGAAGGTFILGPAGTVLGAGLGAVGGAAAGIYGSVHLVGDFTKPEVLSTSIYLVPKSQLGENLRFGNYDKKFCTKLVNY